MVTLCWNLSAVVQTKPPAIGPRASNARLTWRGRQALWRRQPMNNPTTTQSWDTLDLSTLKKTGAGEYHGPCPVTGEGKDCFWVKPDDRLIGCRGCAVRRSERTAIYRTPIGDRRVNRGARRPRPIRLDELPHWRDRDARNQGAPLGPGDPVPQPYRKSGSRWRLSLSLRKTGGRVVVIPWHADTIRTAAQEKRELVD